MRKELGHFCIDGYYGGSQEWFTDSWMKIGGCGAVTACDVCIYLAKYKGMKELYPFDPENVTMEDYLEFGMRMKKYLSPRATGIYKTQIYTDGFRDYLADLCVSPIRFEDVSGKEAPEIAVTLIKDQIDRGFPVPYLMLLHRDKKLDDFMWHWFLLNGYEYGNGHFKVSVVSYGKKQWMDLLHLWRTGRLRKGGFVSIFQTEEKNDTEGISVTA